MRVIKRYIHILYKLYQHKKTANITLCLYSAKKSSAEGKEVNLYKVYNCTTVAKWFGAVPKVYTAEK